VLIMDQPEDHLDNAFIVDTLLQAIRLRAEHSQTIFATHNANVPVLGEADRVILMGSDGRTAFVSHAGSLDHPDSVDAISRVMEGGTAAFQLRAAFYSRHS
jgi:hypothetical protein